MRGTVCSVFIFSGLVSLTGWHPAVHEPERGVRRGGREGGGEEGKGAETERCVQVVNEKRGKTR